MSAQTPLVFVHGAWHGAWCWKVHFETYFQEAGFEVHAFDLRHHGDRNTGKSFNGVLIGDYVRDLRSFVNSLDREPVLVGHSLGGLLVQKYLEMYPSAGTILLAPVPYKGVFKATMRYLKRFPLAFLASALTFNMYRLINSPLKARWAFFSELLPESELNQYLSQLQNESFLAYLQMFRPRIKKQYHTESPMLVISGGKDTLFSVKEESDLAHNYLAEHKTVAEAGHDLMLDASWQEVADLMMDWLKENKLGLKVA